ncbi:transglutaminase domain-containing protein [Clostridium perfringens]|nr:transglutaminase domain-containing protein [Clostridium perfringens]
MDEFQVAGPKLELKYTYDEELAEKLKAKYNLLEIAEEGNSFSKANNLLNWLSSNVYHHPTYDNHIKNNALDLLEYSFKQGADRGINCRALSITLVDCLLSIGLKARVIYLMPCSPYDWDNHVVCEVYVPELSKWIMLDPTYSTYFMDENNNILNVLELRDLLANRGRFKVSKNLNYNGNNDGDLEELRTYFAKNLFYLQFKEFQGFNSEELKEYNLIRIVPKGYEVKKSALVHVDYMGEFIEDKKELENWKKRIENTNAIYLSREVLEEAPI